jgi:hypothetical protein
MLAYEQGGNAHMRDRGSWVGRHKIAKGLIVAITLVVVSCTGVTAANASTVPVVYAANANTWHAYVRPGHFFFGNGGAPFFTQLRWSSWNGTSAWAEGKLWAQKPGCSPSYKCPYYSRWAGVYLNTVRWHDGTRYYARMAVKFWYAGKWRWDTGWFKGGYWVFPLVFPYL